MTTDPNNPEVLTSVSSDVEAAAIVNALAERGIKASAIGGFTSGFRAEAPGEIRVVVRHADLDEATQALAELEQQGFDVDSSETDFDGSDSEENHS